MPAHELFATGCGPSGVCFRSPCPSCGLPSVRSGGVVLPCSGVLVNKTGARVLSFFGDGILVLNETRELQMRSKCRAVSVVLVAFVAVLMLGAIASASASAAECAKETEGKVPVYCVGSKADQDGTLTNETVASTGGSFRLSVFTYIECSAETGTSEISSSETAAGTSKNVQIAFTGCKVEGISRTKCTVTSENAANEGAEVPGTIAMTTTTSALKTRNGKMYDVFGKEGGIVAEIEIDEVNDAGCIPKGDFTVNGQSCGEASTTLATRAPLSFSNRIEEACGAEHLKVGAKLASIEGTIEQTLLGGFEAKNKGQEWAAMLT